MKQEHHKRKRVEKTVRFDDERIIVIDTYSPMEYDRGSIFAFPIQYKINPAILAGQMHLSHLETPASPTDSETSNSDSEILEMSTDTKRKRPRLTIDTSLCADGPLFFTSLSTNHFKHRVGEADYDANDYLIPVTATSVIHPTFTF
ncbi:hypothetical protein EDC96DRAFT_449101 [Choanephora cucurbitarum]|nr:hypothetical protein EDC96DRAFT_449101 [Choanephora cucurbitarum]